MSMLLEKTDPPKWLERFRADPMPALDDMLRGLARVPPYERAAPPDILDRLFGTLPADAPDLRLLDETLSDWLAARHKALSPDERAEYGLSRFVTETMDALSTVWSLELPLSSASIQNNFLELTRRAAPLRLSEVWDLPRALAQAAALTQTDQRLRFHWLRLCKDAARPSLRDMIDPALSGLSHLPGARGHGASPELIAGLARFGAELDSTPRDQVDFLRRWRALKARFPRTGNTWHKLWQPTLTNRQYQGKPFIGWLTEAEPVFSRQWTGPASVSIPWNILEIISDLKRRSRTPNNRPSALAEAEKLLAKLEHYAEATGDAYFFVRSACNLGKDMLPWAPGHALRWARDALRWSPGNGHAWDLRGRALNRLGHTDIAQAVYWEAVRRLPDDAVVRNQLALLLLDQDRELEAQALFREAHERDPQNETASVELARFLARSGDKEEAERLLRRTLEDLPNKPIPPYTLALLLIAWDRTEDATELRQYYARKFGENQWSATLDRLLDRGTEGIAEAQHRLDDRDLYAESDTPLVNSDAETAEREAILEERVATPLQRAAGASRADLLFRIQDSATAEHGLADLLADDPDDLYPQVVWALHAPGRRRSLGDRYRDALGVLAPHLATAETDTPASHWERLYDAFPERQGLIDFTRLMRSSAEESTAERLENWIADGDEGDAFLRARISSVIEQDGRIDPAAPELEDLLIGAIRSEVVLGDGVLGEAA